MGHVSKAEKLKGRREAVEIAAELAEATGGQVGCRPRRIAPTMATSAKVSAVEAAVGDEQRRLALEICRRRRERRWVIRREGSVTVSVM